MTFLAQLPDAVKLQALFTPVLGGPAGGGLAGALDLVSRFDPDALSASLERDTGGDISLQVDIDPEAAVRSTIAVAGPALEEAIGDPDELLAPLLDAVGGLQTAGAGAGTDVAAMIESAATGLRAALGPGGTGEVRSLVGPLLEPFDAVEAELALGGFETLRTWGAMLEDLRAEIAPMLALTPADAAAELTEFFALRLERLAETVGGPAVGFDIDTGALGDIDIDDLLVRIEAAFTAAAVSFEAGSPVNRADLNAALALQAELDALLLKVDGWLAAALDRLPDVEALARILREKIDAALDIEVIDLANLGDALAGPVGRIEALLDKLDLDAALKPLTDAIAKIEAALAAVPLPGIAEAVNAALAAVDGAIARLDAVWLDTVMRLRAVLAAAADNLKAALAPLGSFAADGSFELAVAEQIEDLLATLDALLTDTVLPALDALAAGLDGSLGAAAEAVEQALAAIPDLAGEIEAALAGAVAELTALDLPGKIASARDRLDQALASLGTIELDPIVDPVIAELEEMRDAISELDFSAMGEVQLGALKVSAEAVVMVDFKTAIADAIIAEMDRIAAVPRAALDDITARLADALDRLRFLSPDTLLEPLEAPLADLKAALDTLSLDGIAEPVTAWREKMLEDLDGLSPGALLSPLTDLSGELTAKAEAISLSALEARVGELLDDALAPVAAADLSAPIAALEGVLDEVRGRLDALSADGLVAPLAERHATLVAAVEDFGPEELLAPFSALFSTLAAPLASLSDEMAARIGAAIGILRAAVDRLDPTRAVEAVAGALDTVAGVARQVDAAAATARLRAAHAPLRAAFEAHAGPVDIDLKASVDGLNPLRSQALTQLSATARQVEDRLAAVRGATAPVAEGHAEAQEKLGKLIHGWAEGSLNAARVRAAIASADPLGLAPALEGIHARLVDKVMALDPSGLGDVLEAAKAPVRAEIDAIDLAPLATRMAELPGRLTAAVGDLDRGLLGDEAGPSLDIVAGLAAAVDPAPLIARLDGMHQALRQRIEALDPMQVLAPLEAALERVQAAGAALDLDLLRAPIAAVFAELEAMVAALDLADILTPLNDLLEQLRSELEEALRRAEAAFNGLLGALPK